MAYPLDVNKGKLAKRGNGQHLDTPIPTKQIELALFKFGGNLSKVAASCGVSRAAIVKRVESDPQLKEACVDVRQTFIDAVEETYSDKALRGDMFALNFLLRTIGRDRGYDVNKQDDAQNILRMAFECITNKTRNPAE